MVLPASRLSVFAWEAPCYMSFMEMLKLQCYR
ncbi:hypothetical protein SAMN05216213_106198 [Ectopseudomonas guguanensis]|uniref:Uncharacterized protein n=1 Tax=Ectopseudomonas guguanensis TaxID=1198456 RepID=A0A1H0W2R8_9GAMM|nr:hypothetical protein SAMN05216213_106198 [Pseudomonas guguanensis]